MFVVEVTDKRAWKLIRGSEVVSVWECGISTIILNKYAYVNEVVYKFTSKHNVCILRGKSKVILLQARCGPEGG